VAGEANEPGLALFLGFDGRLDGTVLFEDPIRIFRSFDRVKLP
jgi:hypothetical protein